MENFSTDDARNYLRVKKLVMDFCLVLPGGDGCLAAGGGTSALTTV